MAREFTNGFYTSKAWKDCSRGYMSSRHYICERCGAAATICHHKKYITPQNINDPAITLSWDNLEALCKDCHNLEHMLKRNLTRFDGAGNIEEVVDSGAIKEYKQAVKDIDRLIEKLTAQEAAGATKGK